MPGLAESIALRLRTWLGRDETPGVTVAATLPRCCTATMALAEASAADGSDPQAARNGGVARAIGRAATGARVTVTLDADELSEAVGPLREAARRHVGLLALWRDPGETVDLHPRDVPAELAGHGVAVLCATTVQEAYDAAALGRWLAEAAMAPVLVVLRAEAAGDAVQAWHAIEPAALADWLGRPADEVDAATAPQAWVFGRQRARLVARWDGAHPIAVGQALEPADRRAAAESADLWFDGAWRTLAATGSASWRALTGRDPARLILPSGVTSQNRRAMPMAGHSAYPQRELLIQAVRRDFPDAVARNGAQAVQVSAPADPWLQRALRQRADREGMPADCGSLARLWGELVLPRAAGEAKGQLDPWLAATTTPAASAELFDRSEGRAHLPAFDAARCTACGTCWAACPDAALGAVALGTQDWLDAAADRAMASGARGPGAERSKRMHKAVAQRLDDELARSAAAVVCAEVANGAWSAAADKANLQGDERAAAETAWNHTLAEALRLPPAATASLFHSAHQRTRGSGVLLQLAVDPRACQDCGLCVSVCQEGALVAQAQDEPTLDATRAGWLAWDETPDTTGAILDAARRAGLDALAALLLSRHANRALCGADLASAGSGQRLAVRLFVAVAEQQRGIAHLERANALAALAAKLDEATRSVFAAAAPTGDPNALIDALDGTVSRTAPLASLAERLAANGLGTSLDVGRLRRLAQAAGLVAEARARLTKGSGWGQARYGVVVAGPTVAAWAGRFPRNPFTGPAWVDTSAGAFDTAIGLCEGEQAHAVAEAQAARAAEVALANATDADLQLAALATLRADDLTTAERTAVMPLVLLADHAALQGAGLAGLGRALASGLPLHVVYLRDGACVEPVDLVQFARAAGDLAAAATSVAHRDHLYQCAATALTAHRPSLTSILALNAPEGGVAAAELLTRSEALVQNGVHALARFQPGQPTEMSAAAAVQRARDEAASAHAAEREQALADLRAAHAADLDAARAAWQTETLLRLRDQLVRLARSAPPRPAQPGNGVAA